MRGSRAQAVVNELREKIDIVNWSEDPAIVAANAYHLQCKRVNVDNELKKLDVILQKKI